MNSKQAVKLSYIVNTLLLMFVISMMAYFYFLEASFLVIFSIPTIAVYLINFFLISKRKLNIFVGLVYFWITIYMALTNICLGYSSGYHLYVISMIPVIFYTEYMARQLKGRGVRSIFISIILVLIYVGSSCYVTLKGPVYDIGELNQTVLITLNALIVLSFVIFYSTLVIKMVFSSEQALKKMAHEDRLTGLYNRHYMIEKINEYISLKHKNIWLAMIDLDKFKSINDTYGHNAGDSVLVKISEIMTNLCKGCNIARWGGEEFLIMANGDEIDAKIMEELRQKVYDTDFIYQGQKIPVSITVGVANYEIDMNMDGWVQVADAKLYEGKNKGKNVVVW